MSHISDFYLQAFPPAKAIHTGLSRYHTRRMTTPLHWASESGQVGMARLLIEHGADAAAQSKDGMTPLHRASEKGQVDVARLLIEHGTNATAQSEDGTTLTASGILPG